MHVLKVLKSTFILFCSVLLFTVSLTDVFANESNKGSTDLMMIPLDDRPANIYFPEQVAKTAGVNLVIPPKDIIGYYTDAGDGGKVAEWAANNADKVDGFIISVSMLAYGGLIASRTAEQSQEAALDNIQIIKQLKEQYPDKPIYVYDTIQRLAVTTSSPEYEVYYGQVREWAILKDKVNNFPEYEKDRPKLEKLEEEIPKVVLEDYLKARNRNHEINKTLIDWTKEGYIDNLILAQDDADAYGLHREEREVLVGKVDSLQIGDKVSVYPGADEIDVVFVGRFISEFFNETPKVYIEYSGRHGSDWIAPLEDINLHKNAIEHIISSGGSFTENEKEADIHLIFNTPAKETNSHDENISKIVNRISKLLESNKNVAIADVVNVNKADEKFVLELADKIDVTQLLAYTGWNTAGNTLGITVGHAVSRYSFMQKNVGMSVDQLNQAAESHYEFLLHRFSKDQGYSNVVKSQADDLVKELGAQGTNLAEDYEQVNKLVQDKTIAETHTWYEKFNNKRVHIGSKNNRNLYSVIKNLEAVHVQLPWPRTFEAELEPKLDLEVEVNELEELYYTISNENLIESDYTSESWSVLDAAMQSTLEVLKDSSATIELQEEKLLELQKAYENLSEIIVDMSQLQVLVNKANEIDIQKYNEKSLSIFSKVLVDAEALLLDEIASQTEIDEMFEKLQGSINNLVEKVDKSELSELVNEQIKRKPEDYIEESWTVFAKAIVDAKSVLSNEKATQKEIDSETRSLEKAIKELIKISTEFIEEESKGEATVKDNNDNISGSELPKTATQIFNILFLGVVVITVGIGMFIFRKRKKI